MPYGYYDISSIINQKIASLRQYIEARPLVLGSIQASGGGTVGRPTGFIGALPQTRISYDLSELSISGTSSGSPSLLDNLNHIRYRLTALESTSNPGTFTIKENGIIIASGISILDFGSGFSVTESPAGEANIVVTVSGGSSHDPVTIVDTATIDLSLSGQEIQARVIFSGVNHDQLLNYSPTEHFTQAEIAIPASQITDFDTEVENNTEVAANTASRHSAVTVLDTGTVDLTIVGQELSAVVKLSGIDHTGLQNIGTYSHAQIDSHINDTSIHFDELNELSDVTILSPVNRHYLVYSGGSWINTLPQASDVVYDNTASALDATNAQDAIDELKVLVTPRTYEPSTVSTEDGSYVSGDVNSLITVNDSDSYIVNETATTPGWNILIGFENVDDDFNAIELHIEYNGSPAHEVDVQLYNYNTTTWDTISTIDASSSFLFYSFDVVNGANYVDSGNAQLRLYHVDTGNPTHQVILDYAVLKYTSLHSGVTEHGGLSGLGDDDHVQYLLVDGTRAMTGDLDMGGQAVTNVGNVDGVDVSTHAARHADGGGDSVDHNTLTNTHNLTTDIDHTQISNIGANSHSAIDTHISDTSIHFDQLEELANVVITTPASGELLSYEGVSGNWINQTPTELGLSESGHTHVEADITDLGTYLESETDPVVGAITGLVKADGAGNISAAIEDTDYQGVLAEGAFVDGDKTKLDGIEAGADITDTANVVGALNGATLSDIGVPASNDKVLLQDTDDSNNLKYVDVSDLLDGGATQLSELSDVGSTTPTNRNVLVADGDSWESRALVEADISDLDHYTSSDFSTDFATKSTTDLAEGSNLYHTDERAQDALGTILDDGTVGEVVFTYNDVTPLISATVQDSEIDHNALENTHNLTTDIDHDALTNFVANEHIDWTQASAGTVHATNYVDNDTTDHTALSNIGTNTHAQIDTHIADTSVHFDELAELSDVTIVAPANGEILTYSSAFSGWVNAVPSGGGGGVTDHGALTGLSDDDHTQYLLADGTRNLTGDLTVVNSDFLFNDTYGLYWGTSRLVGTAAGGLTWYDSGTPRFSIGSSGDVLIGDHSDSADGTFHVRETSAGTVTADTAANSFILESATDAGISILTADSSYGLIYFGSPSDNKYASIVARQDLGALFVNFDGNNTDFVVRGDTDNNLLFADAGNNRIGLGTDTPAFKLDVIGTVAAAFGNLRAYDQVEYGPQVYIHNAHNSANGGQLIFQKDRLTGTTPNTNDTLGFLSWMAYDSGPTALRSAAYITADVPASPGASYVPGRLNFIVTDDSGSTKTILRLSGSSSGYWNYNNSRTGSLGEFTNTAQNGDGFGIFLGDGTNSLTVNNDFITFVDRNGTSVVGTIDSNGSGGTRYNTTSDARLKTNVVEFTKGLENLRQLKVREYERISHPGSKEVGFVAQELVDVVPQAVTKPKNKVDSNGTDYETPWMVDYSKVVPILAAALIEQDKKVVELETTISNLEERLDRLEKQLSKQ